MGEPYYSCHWIESGLVFDTDCLTVCCVNNRMRPLPHICSFSGGELPIDAIREARERIRADNRSGRHPSCQDCGLLVERDWEAAAPNELGLLLVHHYTACNLECSFCHSQTGFNVVEPGVPRAPLERPPYDLLPTLRAMRDQGQLTADTAVAFAGGEPTLYPGFEALLDFLLETDCASIIVSTNGVQISQPLLAALARESVKVCCSIDAASAETYKRIKGHDRLAEVSENLRRYAATGGKVSAKMIVVEENRREVEEFVTRVRALGVRDIRYDVNYWDLDPAEEIVDGVARLMHASFAAGLTASEHGGIMMFGEPLRRRIEAALERLIAEAPVERPDPERSRHQF